jgi:signal transduction histidine kinase
MSASTRLTGDELRTLFLFEGLSDEQLAWIAERGEVRAYDGGATVCREGEPATQMVLLLSGRLKLVRKVNGEDLEIVETSHRGAYAGAVRSYVDGAAELYSTSVVTVEPSSFFSLPAADFAHLMHAWFPMAVHLLDGLFLGMRNSEAQVRQREHLANLGTLSANLAHELNNPAAATVRATGQLRERVAGMRHKLGMIASGSFDQAAMRELVALQERAVAHAAKGRVPLGPVEQADLEDELVDRLEEAGIAAPYDLAQVYVTAGMDAAWIDEVACSVGPEPLEGALRWLAYTLETEALMDEIEDASSRISTLVAAVKQYSHLDSSTPVALDVHPGLDSTVVMLGHKLSGVQVRREYDREIPHVPAYGGELNQVWTNLIDNAADAMGGSGVLTLRTRREGDEVVVEVGDDGPGIPPEVQGRVYEAFFTTKPPGSGSGLGLDNARRIVVQRHGGQLDFTTGPDGTTFQVRLPVGAPA